MKIKERIIKAKNRPKKEKKVYTKEEIHQRDDYGLRARDYFITAMASLFTFIILYYYYHWDITKTLLAVLLIAIILLILLRRILVAPKEEEKEGWLITWIDNTGFYHIPPQHNMKLVWGKARPLPDGSLETIQESIISTYYKKKSSQRRFNPMLSNCIAYANKLREEGEKIYFCDGTDRFQNPIQAMSNRTQVLKSAGLTVKNVRATTDWMRRRGTVME